MTPSTTARRLRALRIPLAMLPAVAAIALIPWTFGVATLLPERVMAHHWNTAWTGLDVAITAGLALTSWLTYRRNPRVALIATATTTLMCADAWFDLCTTEPGQPFAYAVAEAAAEVILAAACLVIALQTARSVGPPIEGRSAPT
jgi:hypothetical protein